jgi:glycosidase
MWYRTRLLAGAVITVFLVAASCDSDHLQPEDRTTRDHTEWSYNATIYEVNVRQYTPGGTFSEFREHLPRLQEMGVGILWFMPIHPIGEVNRKGSLGSYYSVRNYLDVNPEFGTLDDFKALVDTVHEMGMYVMMDWVANHTAWDNPLTVEHPDWYVRDDQGNFVPPVPDWWDVIQLDFSNTELREYMIEAMKFWVDEIDIDGFRCDAAGLLPLDFWAAASAELKALKPVLMLAEWESPTAHEHGFDMTYGLSLNRLAGSIVWGHAPASAVGYQISYEVSAYTEGAYRMYYTSNHDENSWNGTVFERLGDGVEAFAVLTAMIDGMPQVYSGQEAGLDKRLHFFDKDEIVWGDYEMGDFYTTLLNLKHENKALWTGGRGGEVEWVHTSNDEAVFAFAREKGGDKVLVVLNLSPAEEVVTLTGTSLAGSYTDAFSGVAVSFGGEDEVTLGPWAYRVFTASIR